MYNRVAEWFKALGTSALQENSVSPGNDRLSTSIIIILQEHAIKTSYLQFGLQIQLFDIYDNT